MRNFLRNHILFQRLNIHQVLKVLLVLLGHQNHTWHYVSFAKRLGQSLSLKHTGCTQTIPSSHVLLWETWVIGTHAGEQMGPWCWGCVLIYCPGVFLITHLIGTATPLWNNNVQLIITDLSLLIAYSYQLTSRNQAGNRKCHRENRFAWDDWDSHMSVASPVLVWWGKGCSF